MKKIFWIFFILLFFTTITLPLLTNAAIVNCDPAAGVPCTIDKFFGMLVEIYKFIVWQIATPLAIIAIIISAIFMMVSAGNPNLFNTGKHILYVAIIGLVLVFGSYLIINTILKALGFEGNWSNPF